AVEIDREDGRTLNQLRPLACWTQGKFLSVSMFRLHILSFQVYGPKAGTKKNENPEKACFNSFGNLNPVKL
ncbi:unnamed protein product, partial [Arabidopsis halleri]